MGKEWWLVGWHRFGAGGRVDWDWEVERGGLVAVTVEERGWSRDKGRQHKKSFRVGSVGGVKERDWIPPLYMYVCMYV